MFVLMERREYNYYDFCLISPQYTCQLLCNHCHSVSLGCCLLGEEDIKGNFVILINKEAVTAQQDLEGFQAKLSQGIYLFIIACSDYTIGITLIFPEQNKTG